jgi:hypothetical protein
MDWGGGAAGLLPIAGVDKSIEHRGRNRFPIWCPDSLETYNGAVTAVATIFIAAFTIVLALVTGRQARLSRESIDLAREEFISTHRPKIIVYGLEFSGDLTEDKPVPVGFRYVNSGDTNAEITGFGTTIVRIIPPALPAGLEFRPQTMEPPIEVPSGMHGFRLTIDTIGADQIASFESVMYSENVICAGYVLYRDGNGTRRQTGFCRQYDAATGRWNAVQDPEYEYSY